VSRMPGRVTIVEVGPRDGLQNEPARVPTEAKLTSSIAWLPPASHVSKPVPSSAPDGFHKWLMRPPCSRPSIGGLASTTRARTQPHGPGARAGGKSRRGRRLSRGL
jgi:hypothetical protein